MARSLAIALAALLAAGCTDSTAANPDPTTAAPPFVRLWAVPRTSDMSRVSADTSGVLLQYGSEFSPSPPVLYGVLEGETGRTRWIQASATVGGTPVQAQSGDTVYSADRGNVTIRSTSTGAVLFTVRDTSIIGGFVAGVGSSSFVVMQNSRFVVRNRGTGAVEQQASIPSLLGLSSGTWVLAGALVADDTIFASGRVEPSSFVLNPPPTDTLVLAIPLATGTLAYSWTKRTSLPVTAAVTDPAKLVRLEWLTGLFDRSTRGLRAFPYALARLEGSAIPVGYTFDLSARRLRVFDVTSAAERWSWAYGRPVPLVQVCGVGLMTSANNQWRLFDPQTGRALHYMLFDQHENPYFQGNVASANHRFYVLGGDSLYAFRCN